MVKYFLRLLFLMTLATGIIAGYSTAAGSSQTDAAEAEKSAAVSDEMDESEWDSLFEPSPDGDLGPGAGPGRRSEAMERFERSQRPGRYSGFGGEGRAPFDQGPPGRPGEAGPRRGRLDPMGAGRQRGPWQGQVPDEKLMTFLKEHEPKLADRLESLKQSNNRQYLRQMMTLGRLYGPVVYQMERDENQGQLGLKRIRLQLKIKDRQREYRQAEGAEQAAQVKAEMQTFAGQLFDIVLEQEELRFQNFTSRIEAFEGRRSQDGDRRRRRPDGQGSAQGRGRSAGQSGQRDENGSIEAVSDADAEDMPDHSQRPTPTWRNGRPGGPEGQGPGRFGRDGERGGGRFGPGGPSPQQRTRFMEEYKNTLASWKENRRMIVNQYVDQLLMDQVRPFPWPN